MLDFNLRSTDDVRYIDDIEISSDLDLFLQELDLIFTTEVGEAFGIPSLGSSIEYQVWSLKASSRQLESSLRAAIQEHSDMSKVFDYSIAVNFVKASLRDIAVIDIEIRPINDIQINRTPTNVRFAIA